MQKNYPLTPARMAGILRDRRGTGGADIGEGNEKAINQLIAHHSVIFQPDSLRFWVSSAPWQLGTYVSYDLKKIFSMKGLHTDTEVADTVWNIAPDSFLQTKEFRNFLRFREEKMHLLWNLPVDTAAVVRNNPYLYDAYRIAGDYCSKKSWHKEAIAYYKKALQLEIATEDEREQIQKRIAESTDLLRK